MCRGTDPEAGLTVLCSGLFVRRCCSVTRTRANAINCVFNFQFVLLSFGVLRSRSPPVLEFSSRFGRTPALTERGCNFRSEDGGVRSPRVRVLSFLMVHVQFDYDCHLFGQVRGTARNWPKKGKTQTEPPSNEVISIRGRRGVTMPENNNHLGVTRNH